MTFRELRNQLSIILQGTLLLSAYDEREIKVLFEILEKRSELSIPG